MFTETLRRAPAFVLLMISLAVFAASAIIFALPFDAEAADGSTVECGSPVFEAVASDNAKPSITVPDTSPDTVRSSTSTTLHPFLQLFTTTTASTVPPPATAPVTTVDALTVTKEACSSPANRRMLAGFAGMAVAVGIGYGARTLGLRAEASVAAGRQG